MDNILVSVVCLAYNHEKYVEKSLRSILSQKTSFPFEIIVNDDASSDLTTSILKKLEKEYTHLCVIYQKENQYSKGIRALPMLIDMAKGVYIAICECDDYWIDDYKLEKQVHALQKETECVACIHPAYRIKEKNEKIIGMRKPKIEKRVLSTADIISCIGQNYALNSLLCLKSAINEFDDLYYECEVGDIPIALHIAQRGKILYLQDEIMSAYRVGAIGSWTKRMASDEDKKIHYLKNIINTLKKFDSRTNFKYTAAINERINYYSFQIDCFQIPFSKIKKLYPKYYNEMPFMRKIKQYMKSIVKKN